MEKKAHEIIWQDCLKIFKDNVNPQSFKTWFEPIKPVKMSNKVLTIQVPSQFFYEWLEEHYVQLLHKTLKKIIGPTAKLEYNIIVETASGVTKALSENVALPSVVMKAVPLADVPTDIVALPVEVTAAQPRRR